MCSGCCTCHCHFRSNLFLVLPFFFYSAKPLQRRRLRSTVAKKNHLTAAEIGRAERLGAPNYSRFEWPPFCFEALESTKISTYEPVSSRKYENRYRTKICNFTVSHYVQRLTLHWITLSTLLMMAHKAETAVQGWSVDPMEDVILTHWVLAARSTVQLSESQATGKSFSLVCGRLLSWLLHKPME